MDLTDAGARGFCSRRITERGSQHELARPVQPAPRVLSVAAVLVDSGHGRKLERYGRFRFVRPEPQAMWAPASVDLKSPLM